MISSNYISEKITKTGVLPVINAPRESLAIPLARALMDGGMTALEITLRSDCSLDAIRSIKAAYPDFLVGAGTLLEKPLFVVIAAVFHRIFAVFRTASVRFCFVFVFLVKTHICATQNSKLLTGQLGEKSRSEAPKSAFAQTYALSRYHYTTLY